MGFFFWNMSRKVSVRSKVEDVKPKVAKSGWTVVAKTKPRPKKVPIVIEEAVWLGLHEDAREIFKILKNEHPSGLNAYRISRFMNRRCGVEEKFDKNDVGNHLYGALKPFVTKDEGTKLWRVKAEVTIVELPNGGAAGVGAGAAATEQ